MASDNPSNNFAIISVATLSAITGLFLYFYLNQPVDLSKLTSTVFSTPRDIKAFEVSDHHGDSFNQESLRGQWSFMFFGYTNCPDVCPNTLTTMNLIATALDTQKDKPAPRFMMMSVDPERDTVEQLSKYIPYFNKKFIGLTAKDAAAVDVLTKQFGIAYLVKKTNAEDKDYAVDHTGAILLINPQGQLHALFSAPHDVKTMTNEFNLIRESHDS